VHTHVCVVCVCVKQFMLVVQNVKHVNQKSFVRRPAYHGAYELASRFALVDYSNAHMCATGVVLTVPVSLPMTVALTVAITSAVFASRELHATTRQLTCS